MPRVRLRLPWHKLLAWCKKHWPVWIIVAIWASFILTNLLPDNTWLMGYDNMLPELNFPLALERVRFPVWQSYRGLGVVNSVMDGAELTRLP